MKKVSFKAESRCPKCGGNMFLNNDFHGWYEQCLQCSYTIYLKAIYEGSREKVASGAAVKAGVA